MKKKEHVPEKIFHINASLQDFQYFYSNIRSNDRSELLICKLEDR